MYQQTTQQNYSSFRKRVGISEDDISRVMNGPDTPRSAHHVLFDSALSSIIDSAIIYARSNGKNYWRPYLLEQWANRADWSRMENDEVLMAKRQIKKINEDEKKRVLMMYIGTTKKFRIRR